jgi:hypothetical protein
MIGLTALEPAAPRRSAFAAAHAAAADLAPPEPPQDEPWMTYVVARENGDWRLLFHGVKAGRFASFDDALAAARKLAGECAALGRTACVMLSPQAPPSKRETYAARGPSFGGFIAPHEA